MRKATLAVVILMLLAFCGVARAGDGLIYDESEVREQLINGFASLEPEFALRLASESLMNCCVRQIRSLPYTCSFSYGQASLTEYVVSVTPKRSCGERIIAAIRSKNLAPLSTSDKRVYGTALSLVHRLVSDDMSDYEAALALHDYLVETVDYRINDDSVDAYSALINGKARCSGYSDAYMLLCSLTGLESTSGMTCGKISGVSGGTPHEWNTLIIDGKTYFVDVTWNDPTTSGESFDAGISRLYFCVPPELMSGSHKWNADLVPGTPAVALDDNNYYVHNGLLANDDSALTSIARACIDDGELIDVLCAFDVDASALGEQLGSYALSLGGKSSVNCSYTVNNIGEYTNIRMRIE